MKITWKKVWTNGQNGAYWHYYINEFYKTFNERPKVRQFYPKVKSSRDNDGRTFQDAHSAYHRLATIKKCSEPGADQITQEEIDLAMEEFKSRKETNDTSI